jgi:UDP-N-acetylmuramate--alanine ligase
MSLDDARRIHFVGIGGAGMSAIAKVLLERGKLISGSDLKESRAARGLELMGAIIHFGHSANLVEEADAVIVSAAIPDSNPEIVRARELSIVVMTRGHALAALLKGTKAIVVAGTHGKTTTTSMIVSIFRHAGLDPSYLVGGGLNDSGTNARSGSGEFTIVESDESDGSFLLLHPFIATVTNVEIDHVDYWASLDALEEAFVHFLQNTRDDGAIVVPCDRPLLAHAARSAVTTVVGTGDGGDVFARDVILTPAGSRFELVADSGSAEVDLHVPGEHNVANAISAAGACVAAGLSIEKIVGGLSAYRGVERRFQIKGRVDEVTVIDDYAHHPTEVKATLAATRPGSYRRVVAVFQPHRYSRTKALAGSFGASFDDADKVVITDVYGAGEEPQPGISGKLVADAICAHLPGRAVAYLPHRGELVDYLAASTRSGDAVLTLGAGDITAVGDELLARLESSR